MNETPPNATCDRCGEEIEYVWNRTRGYWSGKTSGAQCASGRWQHTPPRSYYANTSTKKEAQT
jgi:uncharacterized OB-fold protein